MAGYFAGWGEKGAARQDSLLSRALSSFLRQEAEHSSQLFPYSARKMEINVEPVELAILSIIRSRAEGGPPDKSHECKIREDQKCNMGWGRPKMNPQYLVVGNANKSCDECSGQEERGKRIAVSAFFDLCRYQFVPRGARVAKQTISSAQSWFPGFFGDPDERFSRGSDKSSRYMIWLYS